MWGDANNIPGNYGTPAHNNAEAPNPRIQRKCRQCGKDHPVCTTCGKKHHGACRMAKKESLEAPTQIKGLDIERATNSIMQVTYADTPMRSNALKVSYKKMTYLLVCRHQYRPGCQVRDCKGGVFDLPTSRDVWLNPFLNPDIGMLPWDYFKGKCPHIYRVWETDRKSTRLNSSH